MRPVLPRLLYIGDLPIEDTHHSSVQLYRLLRSYPAERLAIVETRSRVSREDRRLRGVRYERLPVARRAWLRDGLRGGYTWWLCRSAPARERELLPLIEAFQPEAVLTIGSGFGWLVASGASRRHGIPLHLIAHDDWPKLAGVDRVFTSALRRRFGATYCEARSRMCISPFMIDEFKNRYGVEGTLLYPIPPHDAPVVSAPPVRVVPAGAPIVIGFCGGSGAHVMPGFETLARAVTGAAARVIVYGPFGAEERRRLSAIAPVFEFRGLTAYSEMMTGLGEADLLFAPMAFDADARDNMTVSFPSKLVEYTAVGVPIVVHGPAYCSAARWAVLHHSAAVCDADGPAALRQVIESLRADPGRRRLLAARASAFGAVAFDPAAGQAMFEAALQ